MRKVSSDKLTNMGKKMEDARKYTRGLLFSFCETAKKDSKMILGFLSDISVGGLMLICEEPIRIDESVSMDITLPEVINNNKYIELKGTSVRCHLDKDLNYFNVGFKFEELSSEQADIIDRLIEKYGYYETENI